MTKKVLGNITLVIIVVLCFSGSALAADFNFIYTVVACGSPETLDTATGMFTRQGRLFPFKLTQNQMETIRKTTEEIRLWEYPENFVVPPDADGVKHLIVPKHKESLKIIDGNRTKEVKWDDVLADYHKPAANLRKLVEMIWDAIESNPVFKRLPPYTGPACL